MPVCVPSEVSSSTHYYVKMLEWIIVPYVSGRRRNLLEKSKSQTSVYFSNLQIRLICHVMRSPRWDESTKPAGNSDVSDHFGGTILVAWAPALSTGFHEWPLPNWGQQLKTAKCKSSRDQRPSFAQLDGWPSHSDLSVRVPIINCISPARAIFQRSISLLRRPSTAETTSVHKLKEVKELCLGWTLCQPFSSACRVSRSRRDASSSCLSDDFPSALFYDSILIFSTPRTSSDRPFVCYHAQRLRQNTTRSTRTDRGFENTNTQKQRCYSSVVKNGRRQSSAPKFVLPHPTCCT